VADALCRMPAPGLVEAGESGPPARFENSEIIFPLSLNHLSAKTCRARPLHETYSAHLRLSHVSAPPLNSFSAARCGSFRCTPT
jgi:hypothetical protein